MYSKLDQSQRVNWSGNTWRCCVGRFPGEELEMTWCSLRLIPVSQLTQEILGPLGFPVELLYRVNIANLACSKIIMASWVSSNDGLNSKHNQICSALCIISKCKRVMISYGTLHAAMVERYHFLGRTCQLGEWKGSHKTLAEMGGF